MAKKKTTTKKQVIKSAATGEFVSAAYAKKNPKSTFRQTVKKAKPKSTKAKSAPKAKKK
jgi:hypothetical protein